MNNSPFFDFLKNQQHKTAKTLPSWSVIYSLFFIGYLSFAFPSNISVNSNDTNENYLIAPQDYCTPSYSTVGDYTSAFSTSGALTNVSYSATSQQGVSGYLDLSSDPTQHITQSTGSSFDFSHTYVGGGNTVRIWIDWGNDETFDDSDQVFVNYSASETQNGTIEIPATTLPGNYRMRMRSVYHTSVPNACSSLSFGQAIDYTLVVSEATSCLPIVNISVTNVTYTSFDISWDSQNSETSWDIEWGTPGFEPGTGAEVGSASINATSYSLIGLTIDTNYKVSVRANCSGNEQSAWSSIDFFLGYCQPIFTSTSDYIATFSTTGAIVDIDYSATSQQGIGGYLNLSNDIFKTIVQSPGSSFDFSNTYANGNNNLRIWIDWNNNLAFEDTEEEYVTFPLSGQSVQTGTIVIPPTTEPGNYRMRVRSTFNSVTPGPCDTLGWGQTLDFTITITDPPTCMPITNLTITAESFTTVVALWTSQNTTLENSWIIEWGTSGFEPGTGTEIGSATVNSPNHTISGLTENTDYQIFVRAVCDNNDLSLWKSISFRTAYCTPAHTQTSDYISAFSTTSAIANIDYTATSQQGIQGYLDLTEDTSQTITQNAGLEFNFSNTYFEGSNTLRIWIDWNRNFKFEDSEKVFDLYSSDSTKTGTIFIPITTPPGNYRMRVRSIFSANPLEVCNSVGYGQTLDFRIIVIDPPTCMPVSSPLAINNSVTSVLLQWTSDGDLFDIEYGEQGFTQGSGNMIEEIPNSYTLPGLTQGTDYDYYVRRNCGNGDISIWRGPISFTPNNYNNIKIPTTSNLNPQVTDIACGSTFAIDVPAGKQIASLKVDYTMTSVSPRWVSEQRSVLYSQTLNAGESDVVSSPAGNDFPGVENYSRFVNFANGATGTVEFELKAWRIAGNQGCTDNEIFIEPGTWILSPTFEDIPACPNPPTNLGYNVISESSVELFWTAGTSGATHQLKYGNVGFDVDSAGTSEDNLTANSVTLTGLDSSIAYEFYVRRDCGAGDFSTWVGPFKFNSGYCIPTSGITYHFTAFNTTNAIQNATYSNTTPSATGYVNNTNDVDLVIEQEHGQSFDFTSNYIGGASGLRIWVDWDKDFMFDDSEEVFYLANANGSKSGTITVPLNTVTGDYRMRVRAEQGASAIPSACGKIAMGEALDFTLKVNGVVSVTNFDLYEFRYHPNPVNDILHLSSNSKIEKVTISNILGQQVNANLNSDDTILDMSNLPSGNYFVKVTIEDVSKTIKVIKN